jgi:hypothetical protein
MRNQCLAQLPLPFHAHHIERTRVDDRYRHSCHVLELEGEEPVPTGHVEHAAASPQRFGPKCPHQELAKDAGALTILQLLPRLVPALWSGTAFVPCFLQRPQIVDRSEDRGFRSARTAKRVDLSLACVEGGGGGGVSVRADLVTLFVTFACTHITVWYVLIAALVPVQAKAFG